MSRSHEQPPLDRTPLDEPGFERDLARLAKALGHPARVRILRFLLSRDTCMCGDIVQHLPLAQSTVSQHLKALKDSGLVQGTIAGPRVCYCVDRQVLGRFRDLVGRLQPCLEGDPDCRSPLDQEVEP